MRLVGAGDCARLDSHADSQTAELPDALYRSALCDRRSAPSGPQPIASRSAQDSAESVSWLRSSQAIHAPRQQELSRCLRLLPAFGLLDVAQPPGFSGEASRSPVEWVPPRSFARPRSVGALPGRVERRVFLLGAVAASARAERVDAHGGARRLRRWTAILALICSNSVSFSVRPSERSIR